jgi:ribosome-associated protein
MHEPKDEFSHADREPSRSQRRREALAVLGLAEALVALTDAELARLPLSDDLRALVVESRRITQHIARKRQLGYLAKHLRRHEDELPPVRAALDHDRDLARRDSAHLHRIEHWRDRLVADTDAALAHLLDAHPGADRQRLRQLARRAAQEAAAGKPPAASRELFRALRDLLDTNGADPPKSRRG